MLHVQSQIALEVIYIIKCTIIVTQIHDQFTNNAQ